MQLPIKEPGDVLYKDAGLTGEDLEKINRYTRRTFQEDELYSFSVVLCDNEIDRDYERFTVGALEKLSRLFEGRTGIFNHSPKAENQAARIYDCRVEREDGRVTRAGEPYCRLVARAYLPRSEKSEGFILEVESGMKKEVSVGCAVARETCSICGADRRGAGCAHKKGQEYGGVLCHSVLDEPTDAYEWSFVAVPAQREAGVIKSYAGASDTAEKQPDLYELAEYGRRCRADLENSVVRLGTLARPGLPADAMRRAASGMSLADLKLFEKAFRAGAEERLPLAPQLAPATETARDGILGYQI